MAIGATDSDPSASSSASSISVTIRVRPFTIREAAQLTKCDDGPLFLGDGSLAAAAPTMASSTPKLAPKGIRPVIKVVDDKCLVFDPPEDNPMQRFSRSVVPQQGKRVKDQTFAFDRVFDENTSQADVYESTTKNLLNSVLDGYNATVFAYGATGCGKTHTITGTAQQPGIIFLTMQELFERIQDVQGDKVTEISLSYLEIYNETIRDLLLPPGQGKQSLMLREDANQAVSVAGLSSHHPQNVEEVMDMIVRGNSYRTMSPTEANATSSRSHAVLQINVSQKDRNADINEPHTMATLSIIDLAGSERASATKNRGERLIEGANINKSLLALGSCINALCDPRKRNHVPYRNSKLTRLLKFSLGGNCKTVMIVCVSPSSAHFDETQNTLRYANRAKNIQTKVTRNVYNVNRHVKDFLKKIDEQMAMINELKQQQKDYENVAFAKFRKVMEKKEAVTREGLSRIRAAYDHAAAERQERVNSMRKLRQIERRISTISSWIAAFDTVCENREEAEEEAPRNLVAIRKTATGIVAELETSRQHYHKKLAKSNWERALDTALQTGIKQLKELGGSNGGSGNNSDDYSINIANLTREVEYFKSLADREAYTSVLEQERGCGEAAIMQVLLQAHFDTIAIINQILSMDEREAVIAAKNTLGKLVTACSDATFQVVKPDGRLPSVEAFPPTRSGTPKRRKGANLIGPSPLKVKPSLLESSHLGSPARPSPKRRKLGGPKRGVTFTPKKKPSSSSSPAKGRKRGVRWRDDTEDGTLAEFQATPQPIDSTTPEASSTEVILPPPPLTFIHTDDDSKNDISDNNTGNRAGNGNGNRTSTGNDSNNSSPIPAPPEPSMDLKPRSSRFQAGFLSKKGSISPTTTTSMIPICPSSDSEHSPLQELERNKVPYRSPLRVVENASSDIGRGRASAVTDMNSSSSDDDNNNNNDINRRWRMDKADAKKIRTAMKRVSSGGGGGGGSGGGVGSGIGFGSGAGAGMGTGAGNYARAQRHHHHRRRSPTGATSTGSPPSSSESASQQPQQQQQQQQQPPPLFSTSQARRMVKGEKDTWRTSVLSPRSGPIVKNGPIRRTTMGDERVKEGGVGGSALRAGPVRLSSANAGANTSANANTPTNANANSGVSVSSQQQVQQGQPLAPSTTTAAISVAGMPGGNRGSLAGAGKGVWR